MYPSTFDKYPSKQTRGRVKSYKFQQVSESVADMGRLWSDLGPIKSNKRVKLEIKDGGKTPWNSIYVTENCESEIVLAKRSFRREIKSGRVEGDIVVVEELPADGFRELKDGGGRLLFENQNKLIPVEDFFFRLRCNWDQLCRNLFAMAGDQLDSVFCMFISVGICHD